MPRAQTPTERTSVVPTKVYAAGIAEPPVRRAPMPLARRFFQICTTALAESIAGADLTPLEYAVLAYLNSYNGEPNIDQNGLAARLGVERSHASLLVEELELKGLLDRRVNGEDRRARLVRLTQRGEKLHGRLRQRAWEGQQRLLAVLDPSEGDLLLDLLARFIERNRGLARPGTGRRKRSPRQSHSDKS